MLIKIIGLKKISITTFFFDLLKDVYDYCLNSALFLLLHLLCF